MQSKNFSVRITSALKAKIKASSEQTPSSRIRECIEDADDLIARGLIDTSPVKGELVMMTVRLSERHRAMVSETAERFDLSPHQLIIRIIQYLAR